jgi:cobalt/nickel transport system permease protein
MHFHFTDAYQPGATPLHRMDARLKLITTVGLIVLIGLVPVGRFGVYLGFFALAMMGALVARVDPWLVVKRSLAALPFALAAVTLLFTVPGPVIATVPLTGWAISETGLIRFASIMFKSMASVQMAVVLMLTTHFTDLLWAMSTLRIPRVLIAIISFMYRYVFLLAEESIRLSRARDSRSAVMGGSRPSTGRMVLFRAQTTGRLIGSLFLRSFERSERVYQAMAARGYQGQMRQLAPPPVAASDLGLAAGTLGAGVLLLLLSLLLQS